MTLTIGRAMGLDVFVETTDVARAKRLEAAMASFFALPMLPAGHEIGDAPIEEEHREAMNMIARHIDVVVNYQQKGAQREVGFVLLLFPFGERAGRCNYISNGAAREEIVKLLREQADRFEGKP